MKITIDNREVLLPDGKRLLEWFDRTQKDHDLAEKIEAIINSEPADREEARRIAWLIERIGI